MTAETFTKAQLATHAWRLARDVEGKRQPTLELMKCFAYVQRNRVAAGWMGGDWLRVMAAEPVYGASLKADGQPGTFNAARGSSETDLDAADRAAGARLTATPSAPSQRDRVVDEAFPDLSEPVMQKFLWEIDRIFDGSAPDKMTAGGLWWCELNKVDRPWFLENIARKPEQHPRVAQVGNVTLFT